MIEHATRPKTRRVVMIADELREATTAAGRSLRALADELRGRGIAVLEAFSHHDGLATVVSDAAVHCVLVSWTLGANDERSHGEALALLRSLRTRNARVPVFLMADQGVAGTITVEVAQLTDEFVSIL